jgi:ABC-type molybdate transport system substrate-binding protein
MRIFRGISQALAAAACAMSLAAGGATLFPNASQRDAAQAFIRFLQSESARANLREHGLDTPLRAK